MICRTFWAVLGTATFLYGQAAPPEGLLPRIAAKAREDLGRLTDFVCAQNVDRFGRYGAAKPWDRIDTLRLEVGMAGEKELYSWAGARQFQDQTLSGLVGKGVVGTGHFALLAKQVFARGAAEFTWFGGLDLDGRNAYRYDYDVPRDRSSYRLRTPSGEAVIGFQGSLWVDAETLDLLQVEINGYDIPEKLEMARVNHFIRYGRLRIGSEDRLMPVESELTLVATDDHENQNRLKLSGCRQYLGEAKLSFNEEEPAPGAIARSAPEPIRLQRNSILEIELSRPFDPGKATVGDPLQVVLARAIKDGERILVPQGVPVEARLVRLEKEVRPYPLWEVGIELSSLKVGNQDVDVNATMVDAGPESGLIRQSKTLMPTFTKKKDSRMEILVRETPKGQGVLHWDAKRLQIPKGLKMKWRIE